MSRFQVHPRKENMQELPPPKKMLKPYLCGSSLERDINFNKDKEKNLEKLSGVGWEWKGTLP